MGCTISMSCSDRTQPSCDGFRGTPLRLLGYATHVGNACSAILPHSMANVPSMVTTAYVASDVFSRAVKTSEASRPRSQILANTVDALLWQSLATIFIPGLIISKLKQLTEQATKVPTNSCTPPPPLAKALPPAVLRALPCIVGILALPLIMYPIDTVVTKLMDLTYRPMFIEPDEDELKALERKFKKSSCKSKGAA